MAWVPKLLVMAMLGVLLTAASSKQRLTEKKWMPSRHCIGHFKMATGNFGEY